MSNDEKTCEMEHGEDEKLNFVWFCSSCGKMHRDTRRFEKSTHCPACGAKITEWVGVDDE